MGENIRIEIHCINTELNITLAVGMIGLSIWLACLMTCFSVGSLILFVVVLAAFITMAIASEKFPTIVIAGEMLENAMEGKLTELPLMRVYEFVIEKIKK